MSFRINKPILKLLITGFGSIFVFVSCDELESVNPADLSYTLKAPTLVSVQAVSDVQMSITWHNNEEHSKEFVISRKSGSGSYSAIGTVLKDLLAFTDTACVLGTEYSYVVQSKVSSNYSVNSNILKKTITFPAPSNLTVIPISDESVLLAWTDNTGYEDGFKIERDAGSGFTEIGQVTSNVTNFIDTGLTYGQSYNYRIAAYTSANTSSWATITAATEFPAPSDLTASSVSDSEIELTWTDNTDYETGFKIECDGGSGFTEIATVSADANVYTDSGLTFGQSYDYRVAAITANNTSDYSTTVTATACMHCVVDIDDNLYETIQIGDQVWMAENLKVTHYRDGTAITTNVTDAAWVALTTEAYCIYNNNASNEVDTYGALYNWYAVNGDTDGVKDKEIAPAGWHVPTDAEWTTLTNHLGGLSVAGGKMKETGTNHWSSPNTGATNESGFTALPGGYRDYTSGNYYTMGYYGYFWSATEGDSYDAWYRRLYYDLSDVYRNYANKRNGFAVRLLRD